MADVKTAVASTANSTQKGSNSMMLNFIIVVVCIVVAHLIFHLGFSTQFLDAEKHKAKNIFGTMYQGGWVVPILISTFFVMLSFLIERSLTIFKARGKMSNADFIKKVQFHLVYQECRCCYC
jgi:biopolymer transport protein ExbB